MEEISLTEQSVKEYQEIYFKKFGVEILYENAQKQAQTLLNLMAVVYRPIKNGWIEPLKEGGEKR